MAVFSTNQVRQLYVVNDLVDNIPFKKNAKKGAVYVGIDDAKSHLYFTYNGMGGVTRSDLIDLDKVAYVKANKADSLATPLKRVKLTIDDNCLEVDTPAEPTFSTMAYRILVRNYIGLSAEDVYIKHINVAYKGKTPVNRYKLLAVETINSFSEEDEKLFTVYLEKGGTDPKTVGTTVEVTKETDPTTLTGAYTGLIIEEKPQPWIRGRMQAYPINFDLSLMPIKDDHFTLEEWAFIHNVDPAFSVHNGKKIADLEYFTYGERGDIYRGINPRIAYTPEMLVDPSKKYDVLNIHYFYAGTCEDSQKSEKDITLVFPEDSSKMADIITKIKELGIIVDQKDGIALPEFGTIDPITP